MIWRVRAEQRGYVRSYYSWWIGIHAGFSEDIRHGFRFTDHEAARTVARAVRRLEAIEARNERRAPERIVLTRSTR